MRTVSTGAAGAFRSCTLAAGIVVALTALGELDRRGVIETTMTATSTAATAPDENASALLRVDDAATIAGVGPSSDG